MNILLINHYAGSPEMGMEFRPYYFAREWVKMGHKVDIIAADYSHLRRKNPEVKEDFQSEVIDGINYHWIITNKYEGNGVQRVKTMAKFVYKLWSKARWIVDEYEPDVVICSSTYPLDTYVGQRIRKLSKKKVKLIHEVHDMWPISPIEIGGMSPKHPFIQVMQAGENSFCKKSDIVVSLLPATKDYFVEHGMNPEHWRYVTNGVLLSEWEEYEKIPLEIKEHFEQNKKDGKFNLCFFGSLHKTYNLDVLINAVKKINSQELAVTFIGPGMDRDELESMCKGFEDTFKFFGPISKKSIPDLFNYIDATFVGAKSQKIFRFGIAMNKLFDSMMGGKPILYMVDAPNDFVKEYKCGISVNGQSEDDLITGIKEIMNLSEQEKADMGQRGKMAAKNIFNYTSLSKEFVKIMEE
ncbi:glycosyltransferase family 4 protein [Gallibacter intestinalis]|uniref:Glycosyltransferase family 4 protein n=1 Tax=Gallibacter intestinalis TaxID=2779356 RepID=A0ABR9QV35_9FIRM|nr:glycosyltransferase family 4 protein [Gallibacter intestinalis]MBE5034732.1 glycosyltransferase family 4 protein [Gallibacter intestinalis]